jgi:uncharacterized phage protein gp47/JayE
MNITAFLRDFNTLLENHLTDFDGQFEDIDQSQGGSAYLLSTIMASPEWGLYKKLNWIARQLFVSSCDDNILALHGSEFGITKNESETYAAYRQRILDRKRNPVSALNLAAWEKWVRETTYDHGTYVEAVKDLKISQHDRGMGSVNVVVTSTRTEAQGGEEEPTSQLLTAITDTINANRSPGLSWDFLVIAAQKSEIDITMETTGSCDIAKTETDIEAFMRTADIGRSLHLDQIRAIAIKNGAEIATISVPSGDVTILNGPTTYERMWPGTIGMS